MPRLAATSAATQVRHSLHDSDPLFFHILSVGIIDDVDSPITCAGTSTCSTGEVAFGCCDSTTCWIPAVCAGAGTSICENDPNCVYSQIQSWYATLSVDITCLVLIRIYSTDNASPACATYYLSASVQASITTPSYGCAVTPTIIHAVRTSTGAAAQASTASSGTTSSEGSSTSSANQGGSSSGSGGSGSGSSSSSDPLSRPAEIGTIVSTVIGGLALVAAIIFGINQWKRKRRNGTRAANHP